MKIRFAITIALTAIFSKVNGQTEISLYKGRIPNSKACQITEVWSAEGNARGSVKKVTIPTLRVYEPENMTGLHPAVIICPGGGYSSLSIFDGGYETADGLCKAGVVAFVLKYRLSDTACNSNNGIVALQDAQQAMYVVKTNAERYHIDTTKIGYLGFSAGGHLSAMASTHFTDQQIDSKAISLRPAFTILVYPVISFTDELTLLNSRTRFNLLGSNVTSKQIKWYSPELNVSSRTPPAYLIHASDDSTSTVLNSVVYYQALQRYHIPAAMHIYQSGGHGFANFNKSEEDHWLPNAIKWLKLNHILEQ